VRFFCEKFPDKIYFAWDTVGQFCDYEGESGTVGNHITLLFFNYLIIV